MFNGHPAARHLIGLGVFKEPPAAGAQPPARTVAVLDAVVDASAAFTASEIRVAAVAAVQEWVETKPEDLDDGETMANRLLALAIGVADENKDGEISDDEATVIDIALNCMADYLSSKGASDEDISALLNDEDDGAAGRVAELLRGALPDGEDASMTDVDSFVFDAETQESVLDGILDAVYKKRVVVRAGKKVRINKRVSGTVRLSAKQRMAIRKAGLKSRSASARVARMKSVRMRGRMGLNK